jgi:hypothetical protein
MKLPSLLRSLLWFAVLVVASWALRAPFLSREHWNLDEGSTFTMAQQVKEGAVLYRDAADNRSPLVPYLKAAIFVIAGDWAVYAVHLALALSLGVAAFLLRDLVRRLGDPAAGDWVAGTFTVLAFMIPGFYDALASHTEWFLILFSTVGFWLFAKVHRTGGVGAGIPIGLAFGAAALCKQPGMLDFGVTWVIMGLLGWKEARSRARLGRLWLGTGLGLGAAFALVVLYFWRHKALADMIYYSWTYNTTLYVPEIPLFERLAAVHVPFLLTWQHAPALGAFALIGAILLIRQVGKSLKSSVVEVPVLAWLTLGWSASGLISTMLSGRLFDHYSIQVIPGISLAGGWTLARFAGWLKRSGSRRLLVGLGAVALAVALAWTTIDLVHFRKKLGQEVNPSDAMLARTIQSYSRPRDPILVWGYYPEIYLIARRLPSTRFIYTNYLTGMIPWTNLDTAKDTRYAIVPGAWKSFWQDYEARPPVVIVDSLARGYGKYPILGQTRLREEVIDHFAEVDHRATESAQVRIHRRLAAITPETARLSGPVDPTIEIGASRVQWNPDIVAIEVGTRVHAEAITLRLGGIPYKRLELPGATSADVRFFVRIPDLIAANAVMIDAVVSTGTEVKQSPLLNVSRRLSLDVRPVEPTPVLSYSIHRLPPLAGSASAHWYSEPRGNALGWRTDGAFDLQFERPAAIDIISLEWRAPVPSSGDHRILQELELTFVPATGIPLLLKGLAQGTEYGTQLITASLPRAVPGVLRFKWNQPADANRPETNAWIGEIRGFARGPEMSFRDHLIPPALSDQAGDVPWAATADGSWAGHAPSRVVYPRLPYMEAIVVDYGFYDRAYLQPPPNAGEGAVLEINFIHDDGRKENLLSDLMRPRLEPKSRGRHSARVGLPNGGIGEIEVKFAPLPVSNPTGDDTYIFPPRVQGPGPDLVISPDRILTPTESETNGGEPIRNFVNGRWVAHAPGHVVYACPADLHRVTFGFGLEEASYWGDNHAMRTNGIDVVVEFRDDTEIPVELFRRRLDPRNVAADRGVQHAQVVLPGKRGRLVFHFAPGPNNDASYDWSYWTNFSGEIRPARPIP